MSNGKSDKASSSMGLVVFCFFLSCFMFMDYMFENRIGDDFWNSRVAHIYDRFMNQAIPGFHFYTRLLYAPLLLLAFAVGTNRNLKKEPKEYKIHLYPLLFCAAFLIFGYLDNNKIYNLYVFPFMFVMTSFFAIMYAKSFQKSKAKDEEPLKEVTCVNKNLDMAFDFDVTVDGKAKILRVHSPQQGIFIQGGAGSGKSRSLFEPIYTQAVGKGYAIYCYDFKGSESPLSQTIYNALFYQKDKIKSAGYTVPRFEYINFLQPLKNTGKINPVNPKYLTMKNYADNAAMVLYKNLDKEAIKKSDFWVKNGMNYFSQCLWSLKQYSEKHNVNYCTVPHLISLCLEPIMDVVPFLLEDPDSSKLVASIKSAKENEAGSQLSGIEATIQVPLGRMFNKEIYWVMNPHNEDEEIDLNINNADNPACLCICNHESIPDSLGPVIGITSSIMVQLLNDSTSFHKTIFGLDELPTQFVDKLDFIPATMRSKNVVTICGVQEYSQLERDYGKEQATVIRGNLGTQFFGMSSDAQNAEQTAKMFGEYEKSSESTSTSESGVSVSESTKREKVMQGKDVAGQKVGHFVGKVADGEPPFFSCQFGDGGYHIKLDLKKGDKKRPILDIPYSGFPLDSGIEEPEKDLIFQKSVLEELQQQNKDKIEREIRELLDSYKEDEEDNDIGNKAAALFS